MTSDRGDRAPGKLDAAIDAFEAAALWLIRCESWQKWIMVVGAIAVLTTFDLSAATESVNFRALYIIPVALACWTLQPVHAVTVTTGIVALLFFQAQLSYGTPLFLELVASAVARTLAYSTVAAFVLSFRRLYDRTLASARQDQMTGVLNKSAFGQEAAFLLSRGRASRTTMLLAVLDLDGFKQLNDARGHAAGDAVLRDFSVNLMGEIRRSDRIGRIGGDEFGLALQVGSEREARQLARDLHARVSEALAATGRPVTFSMGALIVPPHVASAFEPLMEEADQLLYAAKRQGRNTVVVAAAAAGPKHGAAAGRTAAGAAPAG
ncbi:MAG: GGDEF domain-containing protein [Aquamicrobium sp.]|uniref:GGDEF domain-containing protein n=1 Tax=Aquamicrobium sp. TaxID=1872579 RepID=UPI00349E89E4|nr:GGDEF domain-containing protein [Aquamicrobium sp.]